MDPRKSATVTAPDLLEAFRADTGGVGEAVAEGTELRIWLAFGDNDDNANFESFPMTADGMVAALKLATNYLDREGRTVILVVSAEQPATFAEVQAAISAAED